MRTIMLAIAMLTAVDVVEAAVTCRDSSLRDGSHWQWRQIDGKRCWYRGKTRLDKAELHWTAHLSLQPSTSRSSDGGEVETRESRTSPPISPVRAWVRHHRRQAVAAETAAIEWPDPPLLFTDRFGDLPAGHALPQHLYDELPLAFGGSPQAAYAFEPPSIAIDDDNRSATSLALILMVAIAWLMVAPPILWTIVLVMRRPRLPPLYSDDEPPPPWRQTRRREQWHPSPLSSA